MRISDWSSDVCSSDLHHLLVDAIALRARLVDDPCKHHDLAGLELDALRERGVLARLDVVGNAFDVLQRAVLLPDLPCLAGQVAVGDKILLWNGDYRSEEHTSELQSLMRISYAVFCLKKKIQIKTQTESIQNQ